MRKFRPEISAWDFRCLLFDEFIKRAKTRVGLDRISRPFPLYPSPFEWEILYNVRYIYIRAFMHARE